MAALFRIDDGEHDEGAQLRGLLEDLLELALEADAREQANLDRLAELRFDYCSQHGVWLDAGEIQRFAQVFELS